MFLMLVISRVSIVRITSAWSRMARVVSDIADEQSTMIRSLVRRSISRTLRTPVGVTSSAISGEGGARSTLAPDEWTVRNGSIDSSSRPASRSGARSAIDLFFGFGLSRAPTSPNWDGPSARVVRWPGLGGGRDRQVDRDRRPADAALGTE